MVCAWASLLTGFWCVEGIEEIFGCLNAVDEILLSVQAGTSAHIYPMLVF